MTENELFANPKPISEFLKAMDDANIMMTSGDDKTIWLESEEYGLFRPDFLQAFMKLKKMQGGTAT